MKKQLLKFSIVLLLLVVSMQAGYLHAKMTKLNNNDMSMVTATEGLELKFNLSADKIGGVSALNILFKDSFGIRDIDGDGNPEQSDEAHVNLANTVLGLDVGATEPQSEIEINVEGPDFVELRFAGNTGDVINQGDVVGVILNTDARAQLPGGGGQNPIGNIRFFNPALSTSDPAQFIFDGDIRVFSLP